MYVYICNPKQSQIRICSCTSPFDYIIFHSDYWCVLQNTPLIKKKNVLYVVSKIEKDILSTNSAIANEQIHKTKDKLSTTHLIYAIMFPFFTALRKQLYPFSKVFKCYKR